MNEDNRIISQVIKGDREAFGQIISKYGKRIYGFIYGIVGDENDALDMVQETFLKAYENIRSFDNSKNFVTWIFTIAKNNTYNYIKAKKRYSLRHQEKDFESLDEAAAGSFEPEKEAIKNSEKERLAKGVDSLPDKYKVLICLKYIEGLSYKEIGERLKMKESLVESRIFTARQKLASFMKEGE